MPCQPRYTRPDTIPYVTFRAALDAGDLARVLQLAKHVGTVKLVDGLRICILLRDGDRQRYGRAAVRWLGRFGLEARGATIEDMREAAHLLDVLPDDPGGAMEGLSQLCVSRGVGS